MTISHKWKKDLEEKAGTFLENVKPHATKREKKLTDYSTMFARVEDDLQKMSKDLQEGVAYLGDTLKGSLRASFPETMRPMDISVRPVEISDVKRSYSKISFEVNPFEECNGKLRISLIPYESVIGTVVGSYAIKMEVTCTSSGRGLEYTMGTTPKDQAGLGKEIRSIKDSLKELVVECTIHDHKYLADNLEEDHQDAMHHFWKSANKIFDYNFIQDGTEIKHA